MVFSLRNLHCWVKIPKHSEWQSYGYTMDLRWPPDAIHLPFFVISGGWSPWVPLFFWYIQPLYHLFLCIKKHPWSIKKNQQDWISRQIFMVDFPSKIIQRYEKWRNMVGSPSSAMLLFSPRPWSTSAAAWRSCWRPCVEERSAAPGLGDLGTWESMGMGQGRWPNDWMI